MRVQGGSVMSNCNKRVGGAGRSKLGGTSLSRLKFPCQVPSCDGSFRSDLLKNHYLWSVISGDDGRPVNPSSEKFAKLSEKQQKHTKFFFENNFTETKLPPVKKPTHSVVFENFFIPKPNPRNKESSEPPAKKPRTDKDDEPVDTASESSFGDKSGGEEEMEVGDTAALGDLSSAEGEVEDGDEVIHSTEPFVCESSGEEIVDGDEVIKSTGAFGEEIDDGDEVISSNGAFGEEMDDGDEAISSSEAVGDESSGEDEALMARLNALRGDPVGSEVEVNNNEVLAIDDLSELIIYDDQEANDPTRKEGVTHLEDPQGVPPTSKRRVEDPEVALAPSIREKVNEDSFAEKVCNKVLERLGINSNNSLKSIISEALDESAHTNNQNEDDPSCKWLDSEEHLTCDACLHLSVLEIPNHLKILKRGNFGLVSKKASKKNLKRSIRIHVNSPLHIWCVNKLKEMSEAQAEKKKANLEAATLLATNAALCFKTFGSSKDFVRLNDKDNLTEGLTPAFKNDGGQEFFSYREIFYLKLSDSVKKFFQENVNSFSVTLDKVTDQRVSYTVIVSYFFSEGRMYYLLNSVHKMKSDDYDGEDTAKIVTRPTPPRYKP